MKKGRLILILVLGVILLSACIPRELPEDPEYNNDCQKSCVIVPINLSEPMEISNGDFDLEIQNILEISSKSLGDRTISIKEDRKDIAALYEIQMVYTNKLNEATSFPYQRLAFNIPEDDLEDTTIIFLGYCMQGSDNPSGELERCAYVPTTTPGTYGVIGVFLMNVYKPEPGKSSDIYFYVIVDKQQDEIEIYFVEPEE